MVTGNKYQREEDLAALPGLLGIEIVRQYNSAYSRPSEGNGLLGRGWRLSYEIDLVDKGERITIVQADGTPVQFAKGMVEPRIYGGIDPANGRVSVTTSTLGREYVWRQLDGRELGFDAQGKLTHIRLPTGEFVSLTRDPQGMLQKVTDPQGRSLVFHYLDSQSARSGDRFRGIHAIDTPVGRFEYEYGRPASGAKGEALAVMSTLVKVTRPGSEARHIGRLYHYEDQRFPTLLTGISLYDGKAAPERIATYGYDGQGRGNLTVRGVVARYKTGPDGKPATTPEPGTGLEQVTLDFSELGKTVATNSLGQRTVFMYRMIAGQERLIEARGAGCAHCPGPNERYGYDKFGRLNQSTKLTVAGEPIQTLQAELDDLGRPKRIERIDYLQGKAQPAQQLARYEYDLWPQPRLIARPSVIPGKEHVIRVRFNDFGQPLQVIEEGFSPLDAHGQPGVSPIQRSVTYGYSRINGHSVQTEIDGPLPNGPKGAPEDSDITKIEYDESGSRVVRITSPSSSWAQFAYDETGRLAQFVQDGRQTVQYRYDSRGEVVDLRQSSMGREVRHLSFRYDSLGRLAESFEHRAGKTWALSRQEFDVAGRMKWQADTQGVLRQATYDSEGHLLSSMVAAGSILQREDFTYDAQGRLLRMEDNTGSSREMVRDGDGRLQATIDPMGRWTRYLPQADGLRVVQGVNTGKPLEVQYNVDSRGHLQSITAQASDGVRAVRRVAHSRQVDDFGHEVMIDSPDSGREVRRFDSADRLVAIRRADGAMVEFGYDIEGHLIKRAILPAEGAVHSASAQASPQVTRYIYEGGRLAHVEHEQQTEQYGYDDLGHIKLKTVKLRLNDGTWAESWTHYRYDDQGWLIARSLPDGSELQYERDVRGNVTAMYRQTSPWAPFGWGRHAIVSELQADLVGLQRIVYGNGITGQRQRSREGVLGRVAYTGLTEQPGALRSAVESVIPTTHAQQDRNAAKEGAAVSAVPASAPGALGVPRQPWALWDGRLLFDAAGNIVAQMQLAETATVRPAAQSLMYDTQDQLVQAVHVSEAVSAPVLWRFHHDSMGNRLLSQQPQPGIGAGTELGATTRMEIAAASNRDSRQTLDTVGRPVSDVQRSFAWDVAGQLASVTIRGVTTQYRYNHLGLRVAKQGDQVQQHYLYDEDRLRIADLDSHGRIERQYVWLAGELVAVVDMKHASALREPADGMFDRLLRTLQVAWDTLISARAELAYAHVDHLGAPVLVTDQHGSPVWSASYAPFGRRLVPTRENSAVTKTIAAATRLDLRLPGQWEDEESGLHYNDHRYYDPDAGRYISPDPLGLNGGLNAYAYVDNNPLGFSDPLGLVLFAFDGTGNTDDEAWLSARGSSRSNVWQFRQLYQDGNRRYMAGVGTVQRDTTYGDIRPEDYARGTLLAKFPGVSLEDADMGGNYSGPARIERMIKYLNDEAESANNDNTAMDVDIIGFSRGAAQARDFANFIVSNTRGGNYYYTVTSRDGTEKTRCQKLNLRFMGLFDSVLSENRTNHPYNLAIPEQFAYVAHAVALNEHRRDGHHAGMGSFGGFPLESIMQGQYSPLQSPGKTRIERGFLGAHADIGGGFGTNERQLSQVALAWMVEQAKAAGVKMGDSSLLHTIIANPVVHDKSDNIIGGVPGPYGEDRQVRYRNGTNTTQRKMAFSSGMSNADTTKFIKYFPRDPLSRAWQQQQDLWQTGTVDMRGYLAWLNANGYNLQLTVP